MQKEHMQKEPMQKERAKQDLSDAINKSELIGQIAMEQMQLPESDVELAVNSMLEKMARALAEGDRIEVRGFGSLSLHYRPPRLGRNPKTGEKVEVPEKYVPHFKPGNALRGRVNQAAQHRGGGAKSGR